MELLFIDLDSKVIGELRKAVGSQLSVIQTQSIDDALRRLDAGGIDFVIANKELGSENGAVIAETLKNNANLSGIPFIITSAIWGDKEFYAHQKGKFGANAYLKKPYSAKALVSLIEAVMGIEFSASEEQASWAESGATVVLDKLATNAQNTKSTQTKSQTQVTTTQSLKGTTLSAISAPPPLPPKATQEELEKSIEFVIPGSAQSAAEIDLPENIKNIDFKNKAESLPAHIEEKEEISFGSEMQKQDLTMPAMTKITKSTSVEAESIKAVAPPPIKEDKSIQFDIGSANLELDTDKKFDVNNESLPADFDRGNEFEIGEVEALHASEDPINESASAEPLFSNEIEEIVENNSENEEFAQSFEQHEKEEPSSSLEFTQAHAISVNSADVSTLRKYLTIKEQDVNVLTNQIQAAKAEVEKLSSEIEKYKYENADLNHQLNELKSKSSSFSSEKLSLEKKFKSEVDELRFELKNKSEKILHNEMQLKESEEKLQSLKNRVKIDLRKIKVREKELENKIELLKRDAETLVASREEKILELKRKIDSLEFDMDNIQEQYVKNQNDVAAREEVIKKIAKMLKLTMGILDGFNFENKTTPIIETAKQEDEKLKVA